MVKKVQPSPRSKKAKWLLVHQDGLHDTEGALHADSSTLATTKNKYTLPTSKDCREAGWDAHLQEGWSLKKLAVGQPNRNDLKDGTGAKHC